MNFIPFVRVCRSVHPSNYTYAHFMTYMALICPLSKKLNPTVIQKNLYLKISCRFCKAKMVLPNTTRLLQMVLANTSRNYMCAKNGISLHQAHLYECMPLSFGSFVNSYVYVLVFYLDFLNCYLCL